MPRNYVCRHCGDAFHLSKEDQELMDEGFTDAPDTCSDCLEQMKFSIEDFDDFSDADPGL